MSKELSEKHNMLSFAEKAKLSEIREKIVGTALGWNRIGHQWTSGTSDFVIPDSAKTNGERERAEMKTDFRMDETKQYWLDLRSWDRQNTHNKFWLVCQSGREMDLVDVVWVIETTQIAADLPNFEFIDMHDGGFFIPVDWLDKHAVKKLTELS